MLSQIQSEAKEFQPEDFLGTKEEISSKCVKLLKVLYDFSKTEERITPNLTAPIKSLASTKNKKQLQRQLVRSKTEAPLDNLIVEDFDNEQIWQELQLQNNFMHDNLVSSVSRLLAHQRYAKNFIENRPEPDSNHLVEPKLKFNKNQSDNLDRLGKKSKNQIEYDDDDDDENGGDDNDDDLNEDGGTSKQYGDLPVPESLLNSDNDDDEEDEEEEEENDIEKLLAQESLEKENPEQLSNFEKRRKKIEENIELIEEEALKPKAWQFQGEVTASKRPENSLLEEHLMFDHLIRQAPEITAETTLRLEDIIRQRIKDQAWDDVERKIKPIEDPSEYKKKLVLDAEKSKMSLSQIYEQEYIKQKKAEDGEADKEEEIPEEHLQIQKDMQKLFAKLDALSNFHYTPKPPVAEVKIVTNLPSIAMEEVAPISVSDATLLAPQEIQTQAKGEIKSAAERSDTDRKRERRQKKKKQKSKRLAQEEKAKLKGLGLRNIKLADNIINKKSSTSKKSNNDSYQDTKELKSSKAFFAKLQSQVQNEIKGIKNKKSEPNANKLSAKRFKL